MEDYRRVIDIVTFFFKWLYHKYFTIIVMFKIKEHTHFIYIIKYIL